ncbi:MAG: hypothetical protein EB127_21520 [Alphaproteobacteria bacterium]|nr:hypothetical protein [Alphaproteobacteria bacterium]
MRRALPVRDISQRDRLSQFNWDRLPTLRTNILAKYPDKFGLAYNPSFFPYDLDIIIDEKQHTGIQNPGPYILDWRKVSMYTPTVFYMRIGEEGANMNHALLGIYFPSENMFDIVSTYSIDIDTLLCLNDFFTKLSGTPMIVNDVACLADNPRKLRSEHCYNLQGEDTAGIGWCVAWMVRLSEVLAEKSKEEFWGREWLVRRQVYKTTYDQFLSIPGFNSMEVGKQLWNDIISKHIGGKRKRTRKLKRKSRRRART